MSRRGFTILEATLALGLLAIALVMVAQLATQALAERIGTEERLAAMRTTLDLTIDASDGAGISWLHRNAEVLNKELHDGHFDMTVRVDETKRDIVVSRFDAVPRVA